DPVADVRRNEAAKGRKSKKPELWRKKMKMTNRQKEQGKPVAKRSADDLSTIAPEFTKLTQELLFGDIWKRPGLSQRDKSLITVTVLATLRSEERRVGKECRVE